MSKLRLVGVFEDEDKLLEATKTLISKGVKIVDVYTPFPVHGLDQILGIRRSRLPIICFVVAILGAILATWFQVWTMAMDWPVNIGGKSFASLPAFFPVTFEFMVLSAGLTTVAAFFFRAKLFPGKADHVLSSRVTNDQFVVLGDVSTAHLDHEYLKKILRETGAIEADVRECEL